MYPSDCKTDKRPAISKWSFSKPVLNLTVFFKVLKLPTELAISALASLVYESVSIFKLAPKAPEPLVEVPTPRCN